VSSRTVYLADGRTAQVHIADSATTDHSGALHVSTGSGEAIFARGFWTACISEHAQVLWTPTESPAPAAKLTPTPRFA
jgi:hypothetical protein